MADSLTGTLGPVILDGYLLDKAAEFARDVLFFPTSEVVRLLPGGRAREAFRYQGAGYPLRGGWYEVTLRWQNIRGLLDQLNAILGAPGPHSLIFWRRDTLTYAGDSSRAEFFLPRPPAVNDAAGLGPWNPPPGTGGLDRLATEAAIGIGGRNANGEIQPSTPFVITKKAAADYAADTPAAGEAFFHENGSRFKVGTIPAAGERLFVRMVPIVSVFDQGRVEVKTQAPAVTKEPRDVLLVER